MTVKELKDWLADLGTEFDDKRIQVRATDVGNISLDIHWVDVGYYATDPVVLEARQEV